jgi:outer membrane protein
MIFVEYIKSFISFEKNFNLKRMKRIILTTALGFFMMTSAEVFAQKAFKIGYTSAEYIMYNHPKMKEIESTLAAYSKQHEKLIQEKVAEFQEKYQTYEKGAGMMTEIQRADKEKELMDLNARIEQLQRNAENDLQKKQADLTTPILNQIQKAIDEVREEQGYTYIFSTNAGAGSVILSGPEEHDISDFVFKKLGITPPKE